MSDDEEMISRDVVRDDMDDDSERIFILFFIIIISYSARSMNDHKIIDEEEEYKNIRPLWTNINIINQ